jgi:hypothetical protein
MKSTLLFLFLAINLSIFSQELKYEDYSWSEKPSIEQLNERERNMPIVEVLDKRIISLNTDSKESFEWVLIHQILYLNSDAEIEKNNRVYISESKKQEIIINKIRVIKPDGTEILIDKDDIKEAKNEDNGTSYKYFAIRGLEKGCFLEEIRVSKRNPYLTGTRLVVQGRNYTKKVEIDLIFPNYLKYEFKTNNGLEMPKTDTSIKDKNQYQIRLDSVEGLQEEEYSNRSANLKALSYKLIANYANRNLNLNSYSNIMENYKKFFAREISKKDMKSLDELIDNIKLDNSKNQYDSIFNIESYIKKNINISKDYEDNESSIENTVKTKKANEVDMLQLLHHVFSKTQIPYQLVLTCNRFEFPFDKNFESYQQIDEILLYFPSIKKYISPFSIFSRIPYFDYRLGNNYGLFFKKVKIGENELMTKETKFIEIPSYYELDSQLFQVDFRSSISKPTIEISYITEGAIAYQNQAVYDFIDEKSKIELSQNIIKAFVNEEMNVQYYNTGVDNLGKAPYKVIGSFSSNKLCEKNANKILFKIGELIGRQMQLYSENKRVMPIDINYPHAYYRKISINLPEDYEAKGLDALNFNTLLSQDKEKAGFVSSYTVEGNTIEVVIKEYYDNTMYSISNYNDFQKVINAAADFNKISIILQKKE